MAFFRRKKTELLIAKQFHEGSELHPEVIVREPSAGVDETRFQTKRYFLQTSRGETEVFDGDYIAKDRGYFFCDTSECI